MYNSRYLFFFLEADLKDSLRHLQPSHDFSELGNELTKSEQNQGNIDNRTLYLETEIATAQTKEWHDYLKTKLSTDQKYIKNTEKIKDSFDFFITNTESTTSSEDENLINECLIKSTFRDLKKKAIEISTRKTVIVLPHDTSKFSGDQYIAELGNAIYQKLINQDHSTGLLYAICPKELDSQTKGLSKSLYDQVLDNILIRVSADQIRQSKCKRPGPILLEGETGTGKSMGAAQIAQILKKKLVTVNIAAVTEGLLESTIRGHEKGAFTGANSISRGAFEEAHNGVLFLDELQSAGLSTQTQLLDLLNAVSDKVTVSRLGGHESKEYNVKLIMAINKPLRELLEKGELRYDLYHRVRQILHLPSFRHKFNKKTQDSSQIESFHPFLRSLLTVYRWRWLKPLKGDFTMNNDKQQDVPNPFFEIQDAALDLLKNFEWPGNFRQFERFSNDLFDDALTENSDAPEILSLSLVERLLEKERTRESSDAPSEPRSHEPYEVQKLRNVESILAKANYNFASCKEDLKVFSLGSRATLYSYLQSNWNKLDKKTRIQSSLIKTVWKNNPPSN